MSAVRGDLVTDCSAEAVRSAGLDVYFFYCLWYSSHMKSTHVLVELPAVFATRDYEAVAGIQPSSASRALGEFAAEGQVSKIRRGDMAQPRGGAAGRGCVAC